MKWLNSDSRIIFNVILALIIGIVFGNFIGNSMLRNESIYANANNYSDTVYLLQSGLYYDESNATIALNDLKKLGISGMVVREHDNYYVYHGISSKLSDFEAQVKILEKNNIDYFIKQKKLYYMLTDLDPESSEYEFYYQSINYYLSLVNNSKVVISNNYSENVAEHTLELYNNINILNENLNSDLSTTYKLYVYKSLVDILI